MSTTPGCSTQEPFSLHHNAAGRLVLTKGGEVHAGVEPVRSFPISDPDRLISHTFPLDDIQAAFAMQADATSSVKVTVDPRG